MRKKKSKGKGAAAGDPDADRVQEPEKETAASPLKVAPERAMEIAIGSIRIAGEVDILLRKQGQLRKKLADVTEHLHTRMADLVALSADDRLGQTRIEFPDADPDADDEAPAGAKASVSKPPAAADLTPGHADAQAYVSVFGDRHLRIETFEPGSWVGSIDDMAVCEARAAIDAIAGVCDALELPQSSGVRSAPNWKPAKPSPETAAVMHVAFYKGRRMAVVQEASGEDWVASIRTGLSVASGVGNFGAESDAKSAALARAGYDSKDLRPVWHRASRSRSFAAAHERVAGALPARLFRADYQGHRYEVRVEKEGGTIRATVDGNFGGEHDSIDKAKKSLLEKLLGRKPKKGDVSPLVWGELQASEAYLVEPLNVEYGALVGGKGGRVVVMRQTEPGRWTARVDGSPVAVGLQFADAKKEAEKHLGQKADWIRTETEGFLDTKPGPAEKRA